MAKLEDLQLGHLKRKPFTITRQTEKGLEKLEVSIRILSPEELAFVRVEAQDFVVRTSAEKGENGKLTGMSYEEQLEDARIVEMLSRCLMDPDKPAECWAGTNTLRKKLSPAETGAFYRAYV